MNLSKAIEEADSEIYSLNPPQLQKVKLWEEKGSLWTVNFVAGLLFQTQQRLFYTTEVVNKFGWPWSGIIQYRAEFSLKSLCRMLVLFHIK